MPLRRRSRLQAKVGLKRRSPLRSKAEKKRRPKDTGPDRTTRDTVLMRDDWRCVACGRVVLHWPYSIQHRQARGMGGTSDPAVNSPANLITLCGTATSPDGCHAWCEARHAEARDAGYWVPSWEDPAVIPVEHALFGLVYLLDDGGWLPAGEPGTERLINDLKTTAAGAGASAAAAETEPRERKQS